MTADQGNERDEHTQALGIIVELAKLPPATLLTVHGMAQIFGKSPGTIMRAVAEGRLPKPFRIFSENCWRVGDVDGFLQQRMQDAQQRTDQQPRDTRPDPAPSRSKPLKRGSSPIRLEPNARHS